MLFKMQLPLICITDRFAYYHPFNICIKRASRVSAEEAGAAPPALSPPPNTAGTHWLPPASITPNLQGYPQLGSPLPRLESGSADQQPP